MSAWRINKITGWHVLTGMLFFFAIILCANITLVWVARTSFNGLSEGHAYEKGLAWNETLAHRQTQAAAGWRAVAEPVPGKPEIAILLSDKTGPVADAQGEVLFFRPVESAHDVRVPLEKGEKPGLYRASAPLPKPGLWEVRIHATHGGRTFETAQRLDFPE